MASRYGWIITRDVYADREGDEHNDAGVMGPRGLSEAMAARLKRGEGDAFMMKDDDGELIYRGRIIGDYEGFEPLDDFGMPNFGCTEIWYQNKQTRKWEVL